MTLDDLVARINDPYERPARLYPALLTLLPLLVLIMLLYAPKTTVLTCAITLAVSCGGLYLTTNLARETGKRLEDKLFAEWGGKPTTQLLRHRDKIIEAATKRRYHSLLSSKINETFPDGNQEANNPEAADDIYQSGVRWLLNHTRPDDTRRYDLIFRENAAYGFRRNALGLKPLGLAISIGSLLWVLITQGALFSPGRPPVDLTALSRMSEAATTSLGVSAVMIAVWMLFFTRTSVRTAAFTYAETLLRACDAV